MGKTNERAVLELGYLALTTQQKAVFDHLLKTLDFRLVAMTPNENPAKNVWHFHAPGNGADMDAVNIAEADLRWRAVMPYAIQYDYELGEQIREIYRTYVQTHGGSI